MEYMVCQVIFRDLVSLNNIKSNEQAIVWGFPQGSVLGLLLFNIYVNVIVHVSDKYKFVLFVTIQVFYTQVRIFNL